MQGNITVGEKSISGDVYFIEGGLADSGPLAGDGYFLALHWSDPAEGVTSLKVGLIPSASGMDPVECIDDTDRNGVFKITNPEGQTLVIIQSDETKKTTQRFSLAGINFVRDNLGA